MALWQHQPPGGQNGGGKTRRNCVWTPDHLASWERLRLLGASDLTNPQRRPFAVPPLREHAFFAPLSESLTARVEGLAYHREYEPRQIIYFPGDPCDHLYWVRHGAARITRASGDGRELTFRHLLEDDLFGEECLTAHKRHTTYAEALERSLLCLVRTDDFLRVIEAESELALAMAQHVTRRLLETETVLAETVFKPVRNRVAAGLLRLYDRTGRANEGVIRITHQEIANLAGSTRETTTAVLHGFKKDGVVRIANRRVTILDPVALEHLARSTS